MKKFFSVIVLFVLLANVALAKIKLPNAETIKLDNGLTIKVIKRGNLPLFSLKMTIRAGSIADPVGQEGLAGLTSDMLMRGTPTRDSKQIVEEIAFGGGTFHNFCGRESAGFSGEFLSAEGNKGFEILGDLLINSTVSNEELTKIKNRTVGELQSRLEDPSSVANEHIYYQILGDSRYAHQTAGTVTSVESLTRDDVVKFRSDYYTPDNCILVVCGDIDKKTVKAWAEEYLGKWRGKATSQPSGESFPNITGKEILLLNKVDATQTQIRVGLPGLPLEHPDYHAFEVARTVFSGSFTSRLVNEIRVNRGLSYGVACRSHRYTPGGVVYVSTYTKNESVGEVLDIISTEALRMQTEPVPDSEFVGAQRYETGLYPLGFETSDDMVEVFSNLWLYNHDKSRYEDYQEKIKKVTAEQAMAAARKYFPYEHYRVVLVGKADEISAQVDRFGIVTVTEITTD